MQNAARPLVWLRLGVGSPCNLPVGLTSLHPPHGNVITNVVFLILQSPLHFVQEVGHGAAGSMFVRLPLNVGTDAVLEIQVRPPFTYIVLFSHLWAESLLKCYFCCLVFVSRSFSCFLMFFTESPTCRSVGGT